MQGPSKYFAIRVSGVSGPKLPRNTTRALHPAACTSDTARSMSLSFSTVTGHYIYLIDAATGQELDSMNLGALIEASPSVYDNTVLIGTSAGIWGIQLT